MPTCCVPFCRARALKTNMTPTDAKISFFSLPSDPEKFKIWCKKIDRKDRKLTKKDKIIMLERGRPVLRDNAIPTEFPKYSKYMTRDEAFRRKPPKERVSVVCSHKSKPEVKRIQETIILLVDSDDCASKLASSSSNENDVGDSDSSSYVDQINKILEKNKLPLGWTTAKLPQRKGTILLAIDDDYSIVKKIIVEEDLCLQVFVGHVQIKVKDYERLQTPNLLLEFVEIVDEIKICPGALISDRNIANTTHKYQCKGFRGPRATSCYPCKANEQAVIRKTALFGKICKSGSKENIRSSEKKK